MTEVMKNGVSTTNDIDDITEKIKKLLKYATQKEGHDRVLNKLEVISAGNGKLVAELVIQPEHTNIYGTLHGGCTATIIDICTSIAMGTHPKPGNGVSVDLNISYINPGKLDDTVVIEANTIKVGRTVAFSEAIIKSKSTGAIIAKGSHTKHVQNSDKYNMLRRKSIPHEAVMNSSHRAYALGGKLPRYQKFFSLTILF